jgi:hypothetical protein
MHGGLAPRWHSRPAHRLPTSARGGGLAPANVEEIANVLHQDPYDPSLLISFGTSKGGSAGHLALAIREAAGDDTVYSANFYADRSRAYEKGFYTDDLMVRIPKMEYLFATTSTIADTTAFGLDFGEVYKRLWSVCASMACPSPRSVRSRHSSVASTTTTIGAPATPNTTTARSSTTTCA